MEVITMEGGFRGLGVPTTNEVSRLLTWLNQALSPAVTAINRVRAATTSAQLSTPSAQRLESLWTTIASEHERLTNALPDETDVPLWQNTARNLVARANAFVRDANAVLGDESSGRGLRLTLLAVGSVAVLGGLAWVIYRYSKRRYPRRRRR